MNAAPPGVNWVRYVCVGAFLLVMVFFVFVRVRLRNMPLERDEGEFAYVGQLMLHGIPSYKMEENRGFVDETWEYAHHNYELVSQVAVAGDPEHWRGDHAYFYIFRRTEQ